MKYKVPGHRLLVKPATLEEEHAVPEGLKAAGFVVKSEIGEEHRVKIASERGTVLAIGPTAWVHRDHAYGTDKWEPWCKVGDTILYGRYAGKLFIDPKTKEEFFIINDDDVQLVVEEA